MLASLLRIILLTATLKILERGLDKGPIIHVSIINDLSTNNNVPPTISPELLTVLMYPPILRRYWRTNRDTIMNSSAFDGEFFYVNEDTIVNAR